MVLVDARRDRDRFILRMDAGRFTRMLRDAPLVIDGIGVQQLFAMTSAHGRGEAREPGEFWLWDYALQIGDLCARYVDCFPGVARLELRITDEARDTVDVMVVQPHRR